MASTSDCLRPIITGDAVCDIDRDFNLSLLFVSGFSGVLFCFCFITSISLLMFVFFSFMYPYSILSSCLLQRQDVLIVIKYDRSRVPMKLMGNTFLDWTDPSVQPHFWARLSGAIGSPGVYGTSLSVDKSEQGDPFENNGDFEQYSDNPYIVLNQTTS